MKLIETKVIITRDAELGDDSDVLWDLFKALSTMQEDHGLESFTYEVMKSRPIPGEFDQVC